MYLICSSFLNCEGSKSPKMQGKSLVSLTISKIIQTFLTRDFIRNCRSEVLIVLPLEVKECLYQLLSEDDTFKTCVDKILNFGNKENFSVVRKFLKLNIPCLLSLPDPYLFQIWQHFIIQDFEEGFCQYWDEQFGQYTYDEEEWERYEGSEIILQFMKEKIKSRIFHLAEREMRRRFENYFESDSDDSDDSEDSDFTGYEMPNLETIWRTHDLSFHGLLYWDTTFRPWQGHDSILND